MPDRIFLGWNQPFLPLATGWLLEHKDRFPGMLVIVPTAQSGRRMREALAEKSTALLTPRFATPGSLLHPGSESVAPDWVEQLAWLETIESIRDWSPYEGLFPKPPQKSASGLIRLAGEFLKLRRALQENALTLHTAARLLADTIEAERWHALALLEEKVEHLLSRWNFTSRSKILSRGVQLPETSHIVLAGVFELPPVLASAIGKLPLDILIPAPAELAGHFGDLGQPSSWWLEATIPWPESPGSVRIVADSHQQSLEALRAASAGGQPSDQIALGTADPEVGTELERTFTQAGWTSWHPAATSIPTGLGRWFTVWAEWLRKPSFATISDLFTLPETGILTGGKRAQKARLLARLSDEHMLLTIDDLQRVIEKNTLRHPEQKPAAEELLASIRKLDQWRTSLLAADFEKPLRTLLEILANLGPATAEAATAIASWFESARSLIRQVPRETVFWIDLMLSTLPRPPADAPEDRAIDIQGWLELLHEPGRHLILCGLNEGKVPTPGGGEPWLSEPIRKTLQLITQEQRAARDAFLLSTMIHSRRENGRVDLLCGKSGGNGDVLMPSRLLLLTTPEELPRRVTHLFREIEPAEAGLVSQLDWQWQTPAADPRPRYSITSLATYLQCPFRYYLKHVLSMNPSGSGRFEWRDNDFGTTLHTIMERWGLDPQARDLTDAARLEKWFAAELDRIISETFGASIPLAVRIQCESLRQRLTWLARIQAGQRAQGWKILEVERPFEIAVAGGIVTGKIDRIETNENDGRIRILDYKTGKVDTVANSHRRAIRNARTYIPEHLDPQSPAFFEGDIKGKPTPFFWTNLQLPLYSHAIGTPDAPTAIPGYFTLGATESDAAVKEWPDFGEEDLAAAVACAGWIVGKIQSRNFWPPSSRVPFDPYQDITSGHPLAEAFTPVPGTR